MGKQLHAFTNDVLGNTDATGIAESIAKKQISVQEATDAAIQRAERVNPTLNAIVLKLYDDAKNISRLNENGAFYGVPTFIKDSDPIAGYPTQLGTGVFTSKNAKKNSRFVDQFLSSGLNNLGKTTLPEFGLICSTENERWGITRNPWNTDYTTGGSSSGSAALVAAGVVPIASANDGAGSIRIPASICGLVGLKPTRNRLYGLDGAELMPIQIIHQGVLTRTVRDTALFFHEAEKYRRNPNMPAIGHVQHPGKKRLKIAVLESMPEGKIAHQDADTQNTQKETAKRLSDLGHEVEFIRIPFDVDVMVDYFLDYYGFVAYMTTRFSRFSIKAKVNRKELEPFTTGLSQRFRSNIGRFTRSVKNMRKIGRESQKLFTRYDVVMSPVLAHKTPPIGYFSPLLSYDEVSQRAVSYAAYCGLYNVTGIPSISLPLGTDSNGMPMGVQFAAPFGEDKRLLELAYELEQHKPFSMLYSV